MGYDTVFVTAAPVHVGIRGMLDDLHREWPDMVVAIGESGMFTRWAMARGVVPTGAGEVLVARDEGLLAAGASVVFSDM
jgi:hypothetical protein